MPYPDIVVYPTMNSSSFHTFVHEQKSDDLQMEMDLCSQLEAMGLEKRWAREKESEVFAPITMPPTADVHDLIMSDSEDSTYHTDESDSSSNNGEEPSGCALLQQIQSSIDQYPTTGGEYLEAIFMHRSLCAAFPQGHRSCARCFSDIAYRLEKRAWRADRDADTEAVSAFRHEAWMIAAMFTR